VRYRPGGRFVQTESILAPDDAVFSETGRRERTLAEGERIAGPRWNSGIFTALRFTSPLGTDLDLQWDMHTFLDVRALTLNVGPRSFSIGIGLTLAFPVRCERREPPEPPQAIVPSPLETAERNTERKRVEASISLFSTGPNGERIRFALVQSTQHYHRLNVPLLPLIFFERYSSQIPGRYVQLSRSARFSFSPRRLIRRDIIEIYRNILNIVGLRLSEDPSAVLTITGMASTDEPSSLAVARAEAVFMYLRSVWDIPPSRLRISSKSVASPHDTPPGQQRAVMLSSSSPSITAPVVIDWMEESFRSTPIDLDPSVRNPEAVRDWTISIVHQDREIARTTRSESGQELELDIGLLLESAEGSGKVPPIIARFSVEDSSGTVTTVTDALDIVFSGDSAAGGAGVDVWTTTTHVLRGSDFTLSPQGRLNRDIIRELAMRLRDGDRAVIRPVVDMTGASLLAEESISRDVQHVANALLIALEGKQVRITIERGIPLPPRERDLPETALLSRLIAVTIEHSLESKGNR
ncbi:MAG: hypothetical protein QHI48_05505, partial [Bacteroidota bacterium]|nr:hypothetical protein [Bacteroidota bacterium]